MITGLCCTHGRYRCLQRALRCFLDQEFDEVHAMFICNTGAPLKLPDDFVLPDNKKIYIDNAGMMKFSSVGEKYNHALKMMMRVFTDTTWVFSEDDDDIFLPNHLKEGRKGITKAMENSKCAYKPYYSFFRTRDENGKVTYGPIHNNLEPSIFVNASYLADRGFANVSVRYHQQWLEPLQSNNWILVDKEAMATLIYNWGDNGGDDSWGIYKMSGTGDDSSANFLSHRNHSRDMGNGILVPAEDNSGYYKMIQ